MTARTGPVNGVSAQFDDYLEPTLSGSQADQVLCLIRMSAARSRILTHLLRRLATAMACSRAGFRAGTR